MVSDIEEYSGFGCTDKKDYKALDNITNTFLQTFNFIKQIPVMITVTAIILFVPIKTALIIFPSF